MKRFATNGYNVRYNKAQQLVESCEKIAEGKLPVTCPVCFAIWQDVTQCVHPRDFDTQSGKSDFLLIPAIRKIIGPEMFQ